MRDKFGDLLEGACNGWTSHAFKPYDKALQEMRGFSDRVKELEAEYAKSLAEVKSKEKAVEIAKANFDKYREMSFAQVQHDAEFLKETQGDKSKKTEAELNQQRQELSEASEKLES